MKAMMVAHRKGSCKPRRRGQISGDPAPENVAFALWVRCSTSVTIAYLIGSPSLIPNRDGLGLDKRAQGLDGPKPRPTQSILVPLGCS